VTRQSLCVADLANICYQAFLSQFPALVTLRDFDLPEAPLHGWLLTSAFGADDDVFVIDAEGSDLFNLTSSPASEFGAAWSPRGRWIAFTGGGSDVPAGQRYVQVVRPDGTDRASRSEVQRLRTPTTEGTAEPAESLRRSTPRC